MEMEELWGGGYDASIPGPVLDDPALRWPAMILYANIKRYAKRSGYCYATNETLIRAMTRIDPKTGAVNAPTERTLQSWLSELKDHGHIRVDLGPIPLGKNGKPRSGRRIFVGMKLAEPPENRGEENFTPENNFAEGVKKISPHTSLSNKNKKPPIAPQDVLDMVKAYAGGDAELQTGLMDFLANRAAPPKPCPVKTTAGMKRLLNDLDRLSSGQRDVKITMLNNAIKGNWRGFWAPKADEQPDKPVRMEEQEGVEYF